MKRILSLVLILILSVGMLTACQLSDFLPGLFPENQPETPDAPAGSQYDLQTVKNYIRAMYPNLIDSDETPNDFTLISALSLGGADYTVEWTVDNEAIVVAPLDNGVEVKVDVPDTSVDISYKLTGTIKAPDETTATLEYDLVVPASDLISISDALAAEDGTLVYVKGTVVSIDTAWSDSYKNITVTIADDAGNKLYLYRLGTKVELGDIIKVKGTMATYNGNRQMGQGGVAEIVGHVDITITYTKVTIPEFLALEDGVEVEVSGTVTEINTAWSNDYGNITVTITDDAGNTLYVYRLSTKVELGDVITIKGKVGSYNGAKQVAQGATAEITGHVDIGGSEGGETTGTKTPVIVTAPQTDVAYKFGLFHGNENATVFFNGQNYSNGSTTYTWYYAYTTSQDGAVDVYLEAVEGVEGGYRLYFMNGDAKTYLRMYQDSRTGYEKNGTLELTTTVPEEYYTFNAEHNTLIWSNASGEQNYLGSSGTYKSISASHIDYITSETSYIAHLYTLEEGSTGSEEGGEEGGESGEGTTTDVITTIPGALKAADGAKVEITGIVIIAETWNTEYNNMSVTIKDTDGNTIYVFRLATQVGLGDTITITGVVGSYNDAKQIAAGATAVIDVVHGDNHTYENGKCTVCETAQPVEGEETIKCDFSTLTAGTQYANESNAFGEYITVSTHNEGCHFNTQLRIYASDSNNGYAVITSTNTISSLVINAGYKAATLEVYGSTDGQTWVLIQNVSTSTSYANHTVDVDETAGYKYIKLDATGAQVRVATIDVTIVK